MFAQQLYYNTSGTSKQHNGNIANQFWGAADNLYNNYAYGYDQLNRLKTATASTGSHENAITYDLMGNISALNRYANSTTDRQVVLWLYGWNK
ncbi:hypothetical protein G7092_19965 [Mucilaginibacter sp. HC2]|uniref:hypothetical protein n=1 Tax=Mucilaginibacter inviolabilis TaxID=2714892 RepID=UPI00140CB615|nr:hypothetical protein [Mucilaginibacter inviolabilis]NHA06097.1 hypothetical protein [Mucilaginibacter inviolabilis]